MLRHQRSVKCISSTQNGPTNKARATDASLESLLGYLLSSTNSINVAAKPFNRAFPLARRETQMSSFSQNRKCPRPARRGANRRQIDNDEHGWSMDLMDGVHGRMKLHV